MAKRGTLKLALVVLVLSGYWVSHSVAGTKLKTLKKEQPKLRPGGGDDIRAIMHFFYEKLIELRPTLSSELEFSDKKNRKTIRLVLHEVESRLKNPKSQEAMIGEGHQATVELFRQHIADTRESFELGEITRAYQGVRMATDFCIGCHTHLPQEGMPQLDWKKDVLARDPVDVRRTADFYYVTRRYDYSLNIYDYLIREFPKSVLEESDLRNIYRRKMLVYARVKRDPEGAVKNLTEDLKNKKLPVGVVREVEAWKKSFAAWQAEEKKSPAPKGAQEVTAYTEKLLKDLEGYRGPSDSHPYLINLLKVSGFLYEELFRSFKEDDKARNLYHLGRVERILGQSSFAALGDLYLKECVRTAPQSKWAPLCLSEYRTYLDWRYPKGKERPAKIDKEMRELEQIVGKATGKGA
ncbi:MAG: hypothetical protein KDD43_12930 [Bdellovibrionales bacterium]|nr:hypothetical protein [Bdellovibrionales bacterium]